MAIRRVHVLRQPVFVLFLALAFVTDGSSLVLSLFGELSSGRLLEDDEACGGDGESEESIL
jgi:hypothetical protein